jgi:hypothetical protein
MKRLVLMLVLLAAGTGAVLAEQFYKWKDADGVWRYTTEPPPAGVDGSRVYVSGGPKRSAAEPSGPVAELPEAEPEVPRDNSAEAIAARRETACSNARLRQDVLAKNDAVEWDRDGDGKAERLSPADQARELEKARKEIRTYCPPG